MNKSYLNDALTFLWWGVLVFLATIDIVFPFIAMAVKMAFYVLSFLMLSLSAGAFFKHFYGRGGRDTESNPKGD